MKNLQQEKTPENADPIREQLCPECLKKYDGKEFFWFCSQCLKLFESDEDKE